MTRYFVTVAGRRIAVLDENAEQATQRIADAKGRGGEYVELATDAGVIHILVSARAPVGIEAQAAVVDESQGAGAATIQALSPSTDEFDEWGI